MKSISLFSLLALFIICTSCDKFDWDKRDHDNDRHECGFGDKDDKGDDKADFKKYVIQDLVRTDKCECIVSGKVKYVKNGITVAIVDYGDGTCDNLATKTECVNGDCDHKDVKTHEYEMDCDKESKD